MPELRASPLLRVVDGDELRLLPDREITAGEPVLPALPTLPLRTALPPAADEGVEELRVRGAACSRAGEGAGRAPRTTQVGRSSPELEAPSELDGRDAPATTADGADRRATASLPRGVAPLPSSGLDAAAGRRSDAGTGLRGDAAGLRPSSTPSSSSAGGR